VDPRPAVSIGRTPALDSFGSALTTVGSDDYSKYSFGGVFDAPLASDADTALFENHILPITDTFYLDDYNLAHDHHSAIDDFNFNDFLNEHGQPAPEAQSSDSLAEQPASLQPQFGASLDGCDDGCHAVSV